MKRETFWVAVGSIGGLLLILGALAAALGIKTPEARITATELKVETHEGRISKLETGQAVTQAYLEALKSGMEESVGHELKVRRVGRR